ncbi:hypothetical protein [Pseudarthrobacter sp. NamE5]|uniref:hypothetical protein n=1 Tax=Pseudarthrobacter sp. NamE5 TaxID=2576839 RepID=UPI00110A7031|nr:hypothetical protein [Pseudarthrobacter sp. NamE5]TLM87222.1 hypothetical protein FDW84_05355 [Pseudarthrobacter sp. NamE5]
MTHHEHLVGLTAYALARDTVSRKWHPVIADEPGIIHAVRPTATEPTITEPYFIEDTQHYRAGLCGALVKVVVPLSFKPAETDACQECVDELTNPAVPAVWLSNPFGASLTGDSWWLKGTYKNPGWVKRRKRERAARATATEQRTRL